MKNRLVIIALGLSRPGIMGGNSKITIEMVGCLASHRPGEGRRNRAEM